MTIPQEELRAINNARELMTWLISDFNSKTGVKAVKAKARKCLRHYPSPMNIQSVYRDEIRRWEGELKDIKDVL